MENAIWWIRRDLRLVDNQALTQALKEAKHVIPLFILDPVILKSQKLNQRRIAFLFSGLQQLDFNLRKIGSYLIIRRGNPLDVLSQITTEYRIGGIFAETDFSLYARLRDARVSKLLPLHHIGAPSLRHPAEVVKQDGSPYTMYTPFMKAWRNLPLPDRSNLVYSPEFINTPIGLARESLPEIDRSLIDGCFPSGEGEADHRLERFCDGLHAQIFQYADQRNRMDLEGTSELSPYIKFGMLSSRRTVIAAREAAQLASGIESANSTRIWLNELIWREFFISLIYHFPEETRQSFRPEMRNIRWMNDPDEFSAWKNGMTGYPAVDAGMRQLTAWGWMHNRTRMIAASFLVKDLLVDWRLGEAYFMSQLLDGDPAVNNGSWQWIAGTGTDNVPYFRIFNPVLQGQKFDPHGTYIRRWLPELCNVPDEYIHQPWKMSASVQDKVGCRIGKDYPQPIIDHNERRRLALAVYRRS